jgi:hypothetical protein
MTLSTATDDLILGLTRVIDLPGLTGGTLGAADIEALMREAERFCTEVMAPAGRTPTAPAPTTPTAPSPSPRTTTGS